MLPCVDRQDAFFLVGGDRINTEGTELVPFQVEPVCLQTTSFKSCESLLKSPSPESEGKDGRAAVGVQRNNGKPGRNNLQF